MAVKVSSKGQVTLPKVIRDHLGLRPGQAVDFIIRPDGDVVLEKQYASARPLRGVLAHRAPKHPVSLEELDQAVDDEARRSIARTSSSK